MATPRGYSERIVEVDDGWHVRITSYQLGDEFCAKADNVSPGASLARATAATKEAAELQVLERAKTLLGRTKRRT